MTAQSMTALFGAMFILALYPGVSSLTVASRSAAFGLKHGSLTALGIIIADLIFILIVISGLTYLAQYAHNSLFVVQYIGGAYLIWLGSRLWLETEKVSRQETFKEASMLSSFMSGLLLTLIDIKAILFYFVFFPAYVDVSLLNMMQSILLAFISISAVAIAKFIYAFMAAKARLLLTQSQYRSGINKVTGSVIMGTGLFLFLKP